MVKSNVETRIRTVVKSVEEEYAVTTFELNDTEIEIITAVLGDLELHKVDAGIRNIACDLFFEFSRYLSFGEKRSFKVKTDMGESFGYFLVKNE